MAADDGNNNGNTIVGDGLSKAHGEGKTYLGPIVADGNGLFDATMNVSGISVGEFVTATTRVAFKTSEFSSNKQVTIPIDVVGFKSIILTTDADTTSSITPGDTLTYTIQYVNTGTNPLNNFEITDLLPAGLTITGTGNQTVSVNGAGTSATKNSSYTGGVGATVSNLLSAGAVIAAGGVVTVTIPVTVNPGFSGTITNQASATGTGLDSPVLTDNAGATADLPATVTAAPYNVTIPGGSVAQSVAPTVDATTFSVSSSADLKLTKTAPTSVQAGSSMTYTLSLSNVGGASTSGTTSVKDTLPTGVTVNSGASGSVALSGAQAANWTCNSDASAPQSITCTSTTAIAATSGTSVFAFDVNVAATLTTDVVNQAKVFGGGDPGKPAVTSTGAITDCTAVSENTAGNAANAGCAYESTPVVNVAAFKSVKLTTDADSSGSITAGDTITWTVQYKNTGSADVTTFQLNDQLPGGTTITSTGGQTVTVIGTTSASNNASYTGAASGAVSDLLSATTTFKTGDILKVDIPVTVNSGFTGSLSNQVTGTGGNLSVAGVKTDNVDSTTAGLPSGVTVPTGSVVQTQTGTVDPTVVTVGSAVNVEAYKSVKLITDADASGGISPGDTLNYTIHYINLGPLVSNFQINDPLPTGITIAATGGQTVLAAGSGTGGTKNPAYTGAASGALSDLIAAGANLNIEGAFTITIPVTINAGFTGTIANQATGFGDQIPPVGIKTDNVGQTSDMSATVTAAPYNMSIPAGSIAQTITGTVDPTTFAVLAVTAPSLTLRKSVTPTGDQLPGTELSYIITFTNTGGSLAREVVLTDPIPIVTDFKIGSVTTDPGSTGLTIVVEYSNDYDSGTPTAATWTYTPVSGGGGAATNFDRDVKAVRWRVTAGFLSSITPDNSGEVGFTVIIR